MTDDTGQSPSKQSDDEYSNDVFLTSLDSPTYRAGDGVFLPDPSSPEFPKSDSLPPRREGDSEDPKMTPEFIRSPGASSAEGPRGGLDALPANGETTDEPIYTEKALDGQETKQGAVDDPQSNIKQDRIVELERAKATTNSYVARDQEGEVVDADADGRGEARAKDSIEQVDADKVVDARNEAIESLADDQTADSKVAEQVMADEKAEVRDADKDANAEAMDALKDKQSEASKNDSEKASNVAEDAKAQEERGTVAAPAADEGNKNDKDERPEAPAKEDAPKMTEQGQKNKGKK